MEQERLIESISLPAPELRSYLIKEIDEFLAADTPEAQNAEFEDIVFALRAFAFAHARRHFKFDSTAMNRKIEQRLRTFGTISKKPPGIPDDDLLRRPFSVVHYALGKFAGNWDDRSALKNGTIAELTLLIETSSHAYGQFANHLIVTFDDVDRISFVCVFSGAESESRGTVLCRVPNFLFKKAKRDGSLQDVEGLMTLQILAAIDQVCFTHDAIAHFHSWESGFLMTSNEFADRLNGFRTYFSPYLTITRLLDFMERDGEEGYTISPALGALARRYERLIIDRCNTVVLESQRDASFYRASGCCNNIQLVSFAPGRHQFVSRPSDTALDFIAGGRPVREKGFIELCDRIAELLPWAHDAGVSVSLRLLCRERERQKRAPYLQELERRIEDRGLSNIVSIEDKVPLSELKADIREASALIVPSLYDPCCLMPTYAMEARRVSFISCYAGISEGVESVDFIFDPLKAGDLCRAVRAWYEHDIPFAFESTNLPYDRLYLR